MGTPPAPRFAANVLAAIVFVAVIASSLIAQSAFFFGEPVLPFTDFASNDILVGSAKELALWHGNYSRVGFYHPGPFFFQLMAWSEIVFFDLLPVFSSYFAAQAFAVACLSALALALVAKLLHACTGRAGAALIGASVFVIVLRLAEAYSFWNPWPPYLYVTAATIMITGLCGVMIVGWTWLPWVLLGGGALVHGHASFVGLTPVIVGISVAGAWLAVRKGWLPPVTSSLPGKRTVLVCVLLVAAFGLPIALQTLVHWPGEFPKYFAFAGHREPNAVPAVTGYVLAFMPYWVVAVPLSVAAAWLMKGTSGTRNVFAAAIVLLAGLAAAVLYARKGVDSLEYRYLEFWFAPFYAMFVAMVAACFVGWSQQFHPAAINVMAGFAIAGAGMASFKSPEWLQQPASVSARPYQEALSAITRTSGSAAELVLDRDNSSWDMTWSDAVSLLAYAKRTRPDMRLCVADESWHLLFHEEYRCSGSERRPRVFVSSHFYPERHQIAGTSKARYYGADDAGGETALPRVGDAGLMTDSALLATEVAVVLRLKDAPTLDESAKSVNVSVLLENRGSKPIAGVGKMPVNLAAVQLPEGAGGQQATPRIELQRVPVPGVAPGGTVEVSLSLPASSFAKTSVVRLELVQEGVGWFTYDYGLPPLDLGPLKACGHDARQLCKGGAGS